MTHALAPLREMDLLMRNLFDRSGSFIPARSIRTADLNYPVDIIETDDGSEIRLAAIGLDREDIKVETRPGSICISYDKKESCEDDDCSLCECGDKRYIHRGIARRSFNFQFAVTDKYDLSKTKVRLEKGELIISIPQAEQAKPRLLAIE